MDQEIIKYTKVQLDNQHKHTLMNQYTINLQMTK